MVQHLTVVDHPLVQHKLTLMRKKTTSTVEFRQLLREISQFLAYEITRNLPMTKRKIETPLEEMDAPTLDGKKLALISILRAGNGLLDGVLELVPSARVGFVGGLRPHDDDPADRALLPHGDAAVDALDPAVPLHARVLGHLSRIYSYLGGKDYDEGPGRVPAARQTQTAWPQRPQNAAPAASGARHFAQNPEAAGISSATGR